MVYFRRITVTNIFESKYRVPGYENLAIDALLVIKRYPRQGVSLTKIEEC